MKNNMKIIKNTFSIFVIISIIFFVFSSCSTKPEDLVVGKWEYNLDSDVYALLDFRKDGTGLYEVGDSKNKQSFKIKYEILGNKNDLPFGKVNIDYVNEGSSGSTEITFEFIDNNNFEVVGIPKGKTATFKRK